MSMLAQQGKDVKSCMQEVTLEEFVERYERPKVPVVITGLCEGWRACSEWSEEALLQRFGDHKFKVSSNS